MPPAIGERSQVRGRWLPEEIQTEILSRLPTPACIARFRCVSKSWRRLLSDDLIGKVLFSDDDIKGEEAQVMIASTPLLTTPYSIHSYDTLRPVSSGTLPGSDTHLTHITACSGGIFCVSNHKKNGTIILWNPTTSETKVLPWLSGFDSYRREVGFGFDTETNDYKVLVWISKYRKYSKVYVYSLKENSWRRLRRPHRGTKYWCPGQRVGLVASRAPSSKCHWTFSPQEWDYFLLKTFDMTREVFTELRLPVLPVQQHHHVASSSSSLVPHDPANSFHMANGGSCLVAVRSVSGYRPKGSTLGILLEVWAALDYEALERKECSWIRLYNVDVGVVIPAAPPSPTQSASSGVWEHGKFFVEWSVDRGTRGDYIVKTKNGIMDYKFKFGDLLQRAIYLPSTVSLTSHFTGSKKSLLRRARDTCRSICRKVFVR